MDTMDRYASYVIAALTVNEFKGLQFSCPPTMKSNCYANGQDFLDTYDLETVRILFLYFLVLLSLPLAMHGSMFPVLLLPRDVSGTFKLAQVAMQFTISENFGFYSQ
jgi:hypothetical protein